MTWCGLRDRRREEWGRDRQGQRVKTSRGFLNRWNETIKTEGSSKGGVGVYIHKKVELLYRDCSFTVNHSVSRLHLERRYVDVSNDEDGPGRRDDA